MDIGEQVSLLSCSGFYSYGPVRMIISLCTSGGTGAGIDLVSGRRWEKQEKRLNRNERKFSLNVNTLVEI